VVVFPDAGGPEMATTATLVQSRLNAMGLTAGLLQMDGFHLENQDLDALGLRDRKGAPETFDLVGFRTILSRLLASHDTRVPGFDRVKDQTVPDAHIIPAAAGIVVVEGNYLLLDEPGWRDLSQFWDYAAFFAIGIKELERRLVARWLAYDHTPDQALHRAQSNDIPNALRVLDNQMPADLTLVDA
ncbi:MAG: hypothetical protein AAFN59_08350, partial [Pseudomonadota bacterium]